MLRYLAGLLPLIALSSCNLHYTPPPTLENAATQRKRAVETYIQDAYKDTNLVYQSLLFGETTVVKPNNYQLLDSLYTIKYNNELNGVFDTELEEKINIQKTIIQLDTAKVLYVENHVYAVSDSMTSEVDFAEISLTSDLVVQNFQINRQVHIPRQFLPAITAYLTEESIIYPGYMPSQLEHNFYDFYKTHEQTLSDTDAEKFLIHTLKLIDIGRKIKTIETRRLLEELAVAHVELRKYDPEKDKFSSIDGVYEDGALQEYIVVLQSDTGEYVVRYTPYLELKSISKSS